MDFKWVLNSIYGRVIVVLFWNILTYHQGFAFHITWNFEWTGSYPLDNLVISRTWTIVFGPKCTIGMARRFSSVMVFVRLPSISFAIRAVHEKRINPKLFMLTQNFSVLIKLQLSSAVHGVLKNTVFSLKRTLESILRYPLEVVFSVKTKEITDGKLWMTTLLSFEIYYYCR